jgi:hypothetical protein
MIQMSCLISRQIKVLNFVWNAIAFISFWFYFSIGLGLVFPESVNREWKSLTAIALVTPARMAITSTKSYHVSNILLINAVICCVGIIQSFNVQTYISVAHYLLSLVLLVTAFAEWDGGSVARPAFSIWVLSIFPVSLFLVGKVRRSREAMEEGLREMMDRKVGEKKND